MCCLTGSVASLDVRVTGSDPQARCPSHLRCSLHFLSSGGGAQALPVQRPPPSGRLQTPLEQKRLEPTRGPRFPLPASCLRCSAGCVFMWALWSCLGAGSPRGVLGATSLSLGSVTGRADAPIRPSHSCPLPAIAQGTILPSPSPVEVSFGSERTILDLICQCLPC